MSPTSIILCMAACFVGLVAALIVVNRFGSMSTRKLVVIAMMVAVYVVLNTVGTIRLGWINISVSALPIIVGALLYGPGGGLMVGLVGAFLGQLMTYGVTATTVLWIIPPAVRGLLIGLYAKRCGYELSRKQLVGVLIVTSLVVTLLNTGAIYLDSVIYGYYTYAYVFGKVWPPHRFRRGSPAVAHGFRHPAGARYAQALPARRAEGLTPFPRAAQIQFCKEDLLCTEAR